MKTFVVVVYNSKSVSPSFREGINKSIYNKLLCNNRRAFLRKIQILQAHL